MKKMKHNKKILLNICCAPDATYPYTVLADEFEVIGYFYNPNIDTVKEERKRFNETKKVAAHFGFRLIQDCCNEHDRKQWRDFVKGLESIPEGGTRCFKCLVFRMKKTAEKAKALNIPVFTTTLTVSPHKNATLINFIGNNLAGELGLEYLETNFKKQDGFKKTLEYSRQLNLYRQNYCGCEFSKKKGD